MSGRLRDYLDHMEQAAADACGFVEGLGKDDFLEDKCTQQAVIMSLIIIGEAATKIMDRYAAFAEVHPEVPWRSMRGMRNHIAHGYFDINLDVVWDAVHFHGAIDPTGRFLSGIWSQPGTENTCSATQYGSHVWGRFRFHITDKPALGDPMTGLWGYCDAKPSSDWSDKVVPQPGNG